MGTYIAGSLIRDGQTTQSSSLPAVIPASAAVGDVAIVAFETYTDVGFFSIPSGWTKLAGHYRSSPPSTTVHLFGRTLTAGEPGSTVTFTYSSSQRTIGTVSVFRGVTLTGAAVSAVGESYSTTATLPTRSSVPAGAMVIGVYGRETPTSTAASAQFTSTPAGYTAGGEARSAYTSATNVISRVVYKTVTTAGTYGGETATTDITTGGINYLLVLPASAASTSGTVYGVTAAVTARGSAGGVSTGPVSVTGVTAQVLMQGGMEPAPPPVPVPGVWPPDPYRQAIRSAVAIWYTVDAFLDGVPVFGATELAPTGGQITDTVRPGVRRALSLDLPPTPGLYDRLSPVGTQLTVTAHVRYTSRDVLDIPMGVFVVDSEKSSEGGGGISIVANDKWSMIQRARFVQPQASYPGVSVSDQIVRLLRGALGNIVVNNYATSGAIMGAQTWEKDRDKAIIDLMQGIGAWVFFDRNGVATIADVPTIGATAGWLVDASENGVLTSLDRERSRANTCNVVVVQSSAADGEKFVTQIVWDDDVNSPTYAGTNPLLGAGSAGPFGIVPFFFDTPLPLTEAGARTTGLSVLARVSGLASQVSLGQVPNPAVDAFDVIDVMPPRERYDQPRFIERHIVDTVTHPLTVGGEQHIDGRSTRTEEIEGGS